MEFQQSKLKTIMYIEYGVRILSKNKIVFQLTFYDVIFFFKRIATFLLYLIMITVFGISVLSILLLKTYFKKKIQGVSKVTMKNFKLNIGKHTHNINFYAEFELRRQLVGCLWYLN